MTMAEMRALDEPLSDPELDELEGFLASDLVPQDCSVPPKVCVPPPCLWNCAPGDSW